MSWATTQCTAPDCKAEVIWALTGNGRRMLVDAQPVAGGNLRLTGGETAPPHIEVVKAELAFGRTDLYRSHFVTCKRAKEFRRRRR